MTSAIFPRHQAIAAHRRSLKLARRFDEYAKLTDRSSRRRAHAARLDRATAIRHFNRAVALRAAI